MSISHRTIALVCLFGLGGCIEKTDHLPGEAPEDDPSCEVSDCDDEDPEAEDEDPEVDGDPLYLERARAGLEAWELGLRTDAFAALRTMGDAYTAHNPPYWITVADESCDAEGVGEALRADCPFDGETIGICETRFYPDTGEIVDTTLVVFAGFQEGEGSEEDKRAVFIHELGHCLGLRHSDEKEHVMYPTIAGADQPAADELDAVAKAYLPGPQLPPQAVADRFYAKSSTGATVRIPADPQFTVSASIGAEADRSLDVPPAGARLRGPVEVVRHAMRADGRCDARH